jgi:hypothetical protein
VKRFFVAVVGLAVALGVTSVSRISRAADADDDFAIRLLHRVERLRGGASNSPLEEKLRTKLEEMSANAAGSTAGGFEPPPDAPTTTPSDDDSQFAALQELVSKSAAIERVRKSIMFLVIFPGTKHREEVQRIIDTNSAQLNPAEKKDFEEYMEVRRGLAGSSYSSRVSRWSDFVKAKPGSAFAPTAQREIDFIKSIQKDVSTQKKAGAFNLLVKVGIVVLVLALIAVIVFGAAK